MGLHALTDPLTWRSARLSAGTGRGDRAELAIGPWQVELGLGFDYIYDFAERLEVPVEAFLAGALHDEVEKRFGPDGLVEALDVARSGPERFSDVLAADRRIAGEWEALPRVDGPFGESARAPELGERLSARVGDLTVELAGWASDREDRDLRPVLSYAGRSRRLDGPLKGWLPRRDGVWVVADELTVVTADGREPAWVRAQAEQFGIGPWVRWLGVLDGERVVGHLSVGMPANSAIGTALAGVDRVALDPERGPVGRGYSNPSRRPPW